MWISLVVHFRHIIQCRVGAYLSSHRERGGEHAGQVTNLSQGVQIAFTDQSNASMHYNMITEIMVIYYSLYIIYNLLVRLKSIKSK